MDLGLLQVLGNSFFLQLIDLVLFGLESLGMSLLLLDDFKLEVVDDKANVFKTYFVLVHAGQQFKHGGVIDLVEMDFFDQVFVDQR